MQTWKTAVLKRLRELLIGAEHSTPYMQQQNPVELRAIKWLKNSWRILQRRQGCPDQVWLYGLKYLADVNNITADESLDWDVPLTKRHAIVTDISPYLFFQFYEKVYYLDSVEKFPSSNEQAGFWLGVAHTTGDLLTYYILTNDTEKVIVRSVVRPATADVNKVRKFDPGLVHKTPDMLLNQETDVAPNQLEIPPPMLKRDSPPDRDRIPEPVPKPTEPNPDLPPQQETGSASEAMDKSTADEPGLETSDTSMTKETIFSDQQIYNRTRDKTRKALRRRLREKKRSQPKKKRGNTTLSSTKIDPEPTDDAEQIGETGELSDSEAEETEGIGETLESIPEAQSFLEETDTDSSDDDNSSFFHSTVYPPRIPVYLPKPALDQAPPLPRRSLRNRERLRGPKRLNLKMSTTKQSCYRALQLLAASGVLLLSNTPVQALNNSNPHFVDNHFDQSLAPSFPEYNWNAAHMDQINYLSAVDMVSEDVDADWEPMHVLKHKVSKKKGKRVVQVQVQWKSLRKSWVDLQAVRVQSPVVLMEYATRMQIPIVPSNSDTSFRSYKPCAL